MNEETFVRKRESDWKRLAYLCDRADVSPANLTPPELKEFVQLYRKVSADLSLVRTKSSNIGLITFLNDLCGRAYSLFYRPPRGSIVASLKRAIRTAAQTARKQKWALFASTFVFVGSAILASMLLTVRPETTRVLVPAEMRPLFDSWKEGKHEERDGGESTLASAMYASNNPRVAIMTGAVAAGTFGVLTTNILYENGVILGALSKEMNDVGKLGFLLASVMPHGVTELSGIVFAGASGYVMAWALINPGRRKRSEALLAAGKDALTLLLIAVTMMFMAAPIEGYFSFNPGVPSFAKVGFAVATAVAWGLFWIGFAKDDEQSLEHQNRESRHTM